MVSIRLPFEVLYTWLNKNDRYIELLKSGSFQNEVKSAYNYLERKAANRVKIKTIMQFTEAVQQKVSIQFVKEVAEAYFSGKNVAKVEEETISNSK